MLSKHRDICEQHAAVQAACLRSPHPAAFSHRIIYCNASVIHLLASHVLISGLWDKYVYVSSEWLVKRQSALKMLMNLYKVKKNCNFSKRVIFVCYINLNSKSLPQFKLFSIRYRLQGHRSCHSEEFGISPLDTYFKSLSAEFNFSHHSNI